eukprot:TRINITY_DN9122_c0_g1_i1.p1 TRINITY_DN9122_c0_g1~~TRINITY_DN9122_c0_g1_i1.p1  ORF type:complete len:113 (-),score=18.98 TRINITY_DN9122_c0_g1_i1:27-365(-)
MNEGKERLKYDVLLVPILRCMLDKKGPVKKPAQAIGKIMCQELGIKFVKKILKDFRSTEQSDIMKIFKEFEAPQSDSKKDDSKQKKAKKVGVRGQKRTKKEKSNRTRRRPLV